MRLKELKRDLGFAAGLVRRRPFQCLIQVTNRCNMTCPFCDFWPHGVRPALELSVDDYRRVEEQLSEMGRFLISIEGGEPFVRPDLIEIVQVFAARHIAALYTNGWFVNDQSARELFQAGLTQVGVSIDYADAERHDKNRGIVGAAAQAWQAVETLRDAAPHGGKQVHVMTVFMRDNVEDLERLFEMSAARGVGHCITLLSIKGFRRGKGGSEWPLLTVSQHLLQLWRRFPHFRVFRDYLGLMDEFLSSSGGHHGDDGRNSSMPRCHAGLQSFNIDHVGNVSPCIEKIDTVVGNVRRESLAEIHGRLVQLDAGANCQDCWTLCRGFSQALGAGGTLRSWWDLATRMRSA